MTTYHGEIFKNGFKWIAIDESGGLVTIKTDHEGGRSDFWMSAPVARELARHLFAATQPYVLTDIKQEGKP